MSSLAEGLLNDVGSVVSILTFAYAVGIGLYLYFKTTANSSQEINEFLVSLQFSYEEIRAFAQSYATTQEAENVEMDTPEAEAQALAVKAQLIEGHTRNRLEALRKLALKVGTMANDSYFKMWTNRARFVLLQDELEKNVAGKDRLMDEMRRVQERFSKLEDERRERERAALVTQQNKLLKDVLQRLDNLENGHTKRMARVESSRASMASSETAVEE